MGTRETPSHCRECGQPLRLVFARYYADLAEPDVATFRLVHACPSKHREYGWLRVPLRPR